MLAESERARSALGKHLLAGWQQAYQAVRQRLLQALVQVEQTFGPLGQLDCGMAVSHEDLALGDGPSQGNLKAPARHFSHLRTYWDFRPHHRYRECGPPTPLA